MNLGLVEVGSRAIRMLVATPDLRGGIRTLAAKSEVVPRGPASSEWVAQVAQSVARLQDSATRHRTDQIEVYGTESLRRLEPELKANLSQAIPGIRVLSQEEEAQACHASACLVGRMVGSKAGDTILAADFGSGSLELGAGPRHSPGRLEWLCTTKLGAKRLREIYVEQGLASVTNTVKADLRQSPFPASLAATASMFVSGSAATKVAWLKHRIDAGDPLGLPYSLDAVQGVFVQAAFLRQLAAQLHRERLRDRAGLSAMLNLDENADMELIISGVQAILACLEHVGKTTCHVNAFGSRHGLAWLKLLGESAVAG